ncbi:MAG TPA: glucans biosynthesis glucosyltransferase MdoH [Kiloniellales bacterium]|nr:glucans biosynthesis glucosyltransferase MdoH [Kiloniellales bacterium]
MRDWTGFSDFLSRAAVLGGSLATTGIASWAFLDLLSWSGFGLAESFYLAIFAFLTFWLSLSFWHGLCGFFAACTGWRQPGLRQPSAGSPVPARVAILVPVYNENPNNVFANIAAMYEGLARLPAGRHFDFFVLSDTTDPKVWVAEEAAWFAARRLLQGGGSLHYRRRTRNEGRKAGNIADFCRRWGAHYEAMVVLDADSLMAPETLVTMAQTLEANPRLGLLQVPPTLIKRSTCFARLQQWASMIATPILAHGLAFWGGAQGNFWGHNAIIRTQAFTQSCGLPDLPGRKPFGGHIMSHDFVEAALLVRAGWEVRMAPDLGGSWEEPPPTALDHAMRDRRWCQGNLQHAKVLPARGLHWVSRLHLAQGIMAYLASPIWLAFLLLGLALIAVQPVASTSALATAELQESALLLTGLIATLLFAPRIFGLVLLLASSRQRRLVGGSLRASLSTLLEILASILLAPVMLIWHVRFVYEIFRGKDGGWSNQTRDDGATLPFGFAFAATRVQFFAGILALGVLALLPAGLAWWFSPIAAGLLLAPVTLWLGSSPALGRAARSLGLFLIPEETAAPRVVRRAEELSRHPLVALPDSGLQALLHDRRLLLLHRALVAAAGDPPAPELLQLALRKQESGQPLERNEEAALLSDLAALTRVLHRRQLA